MSKKGLMIIGLGVLAMFFCCQDRVVYSQSIDIDNLISCGEGMVCCPLPFCECPPDTPCEVVGVEECEIELYIKGGSDTTGTLTVTSCCVCERTWCDEANDCEIITEPCDCPPDCGDGCTTPDEVCETPGDHGPGLACCVCGQVCEECELCTYPDLMNE